MATESLLRKKKIHLAVNAINYSFLGVTWLQIMLLKINRPALNVYSDHGITLQVFFNEIEYFSYIQAVP